jgi:hypothetical protein
LFVGWRCGSATGSLGWAWSLKLGILNGSGGAADPYAVPIALLRRLDVAASGAVLVWRN